MKGGITHDIRLIYECRCDERLKAKAEGSTRLAYTGLRGVLGHLKIETRLIDERFAAGTFIFFISHFFFIFHIWVPATYLKGS
jgi:hypothetical protein